MSPIIVGPTPSTTLSTVVLDQLAPWLTPDNDPAGDHSNFLLAVSTMGQEIFGLVMDSGDPDDPSWVPGWGVLFDVDLCPYKYLPFLAQLVGVTIPAGLGDADARSFIRAEQGMQRGTPGAIQAAATRWLTGTQSLSLLERVQLNGTADGYAFVLVVRPEELIDLNGLTAAVNATKPAGLNWWLVQTDGWTISQMEIGYASITALEAAFSTLSHLETDVLG